LKSAGSLIRWRNPEQRPKRILTIKENWHSFQSDLFADTEAGGISFFSRGEQTGVELVKFGELEGKIKNLVQDFNVLKKRNEELEKLLEVRSGELKEAEYKIKQINEERNSVRQKVDSLLGLLEDIDPSQ
jgi:hypothetical protein